MLDIEITPEKSISSEKWQIILGEKQLFLNIDLKLSLVIKLILFKTNFLY